MQNWEKYHEIVIKNRKALETIAWTILQNASLSPQIPLSSASLIGATLSRDSNTIPFLIRAMQGTNAHARLLAVKFAHLYRDTILIEELSKMVHKEKNWIIRLEVIRAIGTLQVTSLQKTLEKIVFDPQTIYEEKKIALKSLVKMYDTIDSATLETLLQSDRSESRILGCHLASRFHVQEVATSLVKLLNDFSPMVKTAALQAIGVLKIPLSSAQIEQMVNDPAAEVSITACWGAVLQKNNIGILRLQDWIKNKNPQYRAMGAATLGRCGISAMSCALEEIDKNPDIFVKINLAIGLIGERVDTQKAGEVIYNIMQSQETPLLMWDENFPFLMIIPNKAHHIDQIPHYPTMINQMVHLRLLNILSIIHHPKAQEGLKNFTKNTTWESTGEAIALLLKEGDETTMNIVENLLADTDPHIRVQAAFILAMTGKNRKGIEILQEAYPSMNRDTKIQILEAIGKVGDFSSIPFLISILHQPFQLLRIVAAAAIIQCLYN